MADRVTQTWEIKAECELRCEIRDGDTLTLRLVEGTAEIFGVEMAWHRDYSFINENFAIFTWYGCKVDATSSGKSQLYVSDETPMVSCVNTHAQLEVRRDVAVANQDVGPRVLIVGNQDSGKSTTARILAGYATRLDRTPIYIDLDVSEGIFGGIPGCIGAIPLDKSSLSIDEGFSSPNPLAFFFGHNTIKDNPKHYIHLVSTLARNVKARLALDQEAASSGLIINTNGQIDPVEKSLEVILHAVKVFDVDVVLVMSHDRLYSTLSQQLPESVTVVKLPSSGGLVRRDAGTRRSVRKAKINQYFYGSQVFQNTPQALNPSQMVFPLSKLVILRPGGVQISAAMRPIGSTDSSASDGGGKAIIVRPSQELKNSLLAVIHPPSDFSQDATGATVTSSDGVVIPAGLLEANVAGLLYVSDLDVEKDTITVLAPCPTSVDALPSKYMLVGAMKWME